jgi:hypothetical protein
MVDTVVEVTEVEGEAEVADLELAVEEDSGDDGNGFYDNLAYLLAFRAGSWNTCTINAIKMKRIQGFHEAKQEIMMLISIGWDISRSVFL